jgi:hypothetical protein
LLWLFWRWSPMNYFPCLSHQLNMCARAHAHTHTHTHTHTLDCLIEILMVLWIM